MAAEVPRVTSTNFTRDLNPGSQDIFVDWYLLVEHSEYISDQN